MKFSVIVAVDPNRQTVKKLLGSLKEQTFSNYEVILVVDEKATTLQDMIQPYLSDNRYRMLLKTNRGLATARNFGMENATGDYLIWIDDDDYVDQDFLQQLSVAVTDNPGIDLIKYQLHVVDNDGQVQRRVFDTAFSKLPTLEAFRILIQSDYVEPAVLYAYRSSFLKENGLTFQDGKQECDFGFVPLALIYAKQIMSLTYAGFYFTKRNRKQYVAGSEKATRIVYDTLFQYDYMMKKVGEDESLSEDLKRKFFDYISYNVILKGTILPDESIPAYTLELEKRNVTNYLIANTISKMITKIKIERDMTAFIKKNKGKK